MSTPYEIEMDLRWSDQDAQGHVNNAKVVTLAEEARIRFHAHLASLRAQDGDQNGTHNSGLGGGVVVARQEIDYHASVHYAPSLTLQVSVLRIGTKSYAVRQHAIQDGRDVFTVDSVLVRLGEDGASRALSGQERAELEAWAV